MSRDGTQITVQFAGSRPHKASDPCSARYKANTFESAQHVRIAIAAVAPRNVDRRVCSMEGYSRTVTAALKAPLGNRAVLDSSGRPQQVAP